MENNLQLTPLISKTVSGDRDAFTQLIQSHMGIIFSKARRNAKSAEDAEDITQKVILQVYKYICSLKNPAAFSSWLNRIILNECARHYKKNDHGILFEDVSDVESRISDTDEDYLPCANLERLERLKTVRAAIDRLPHASKNMLVLYYNDGMCYKKIAEHMNVSVGSVSIGIHRAKKRLRKDLRLSG